MEDLVKVFKALSDETRLKILLIISKRTICQKGISRHLGISESAVSQHIKVLKESGIVTGIKQGYSVIYVINDDCFKEAKLGIFAEAGRGFGIKKHKGGGRILYSLRFAVYLFHE